MLSRIFNTVDTNTTAYSVAKYDPTVPLKVSHRITDSFLPVSWDAKPHFRATSPSRLLTRLLSTT